jgi:zinc/manganese transport system ATP-binding protein
LDALADSHAVAPSGAPAGLLSGAPADVLSGAAADVLSGASADALSGVPAIEMRGVTLGFPGRVVLRNVDLTVRQGEFVGVLGPNGAGKTTLLRAVLGLLAPQAGQVDVFGGGARPGHASIGYLPQMRNGALPPVRGIDLLAASLNGARWGVPWHGAAARAEIDWALEQVEARALALRPIAQLSGGERQRVLIAQALLGRPKLLLLDEPLSNLDPRHQHAVVRLLRDIQLRLGLTVLCIAHDLNVVLPAVDRVLYTGNGQVALGAVDEVVTGPVLSRLYGSPIEVVRAGAHRFVVALDAA